MGGGVSWYRVLQKLITLAVLVVAAMVPASQSDAEFFEWTNPLGGEFAEPGNWTGTGIPDDTFDTVEFDLPNTYSVTLPTGVTTSIGPLGVYDGTLTMASNGPAVAILSATDVDIAASTLLIDESGGSGRLDMVAESLKVQEDGLLTLNAGSTATVSGNFRVGSFLEPGIGTVNVLGGSTIEFGTSATNRLFIGHNASDLPDVSSVTVSDPGSVVRGANGTKIDVGFNAAALLHVNHGGSVELPDGLLGIAATAESTGAELLIENTAMFSLLDTGDGSYGSTVLGHSTTGSGTVTLRSGGVLRAGDFMAVGQSIAQVENSGSNLLAESLHLGNQARLEVSNGGRFELVRAGTNTIIGAARLSISGSGSLGLMDTTVELAGTSPSEVSKLAVLEAGQIITSESLVPGELHLVVSNYGLVDVVGAGSSLDVGTGSIDLRAPSLDAARLDVSDSASVVTPTLSVGATPATAGHVVVDGGILSSSDANVGATVVGGLPSDGGNGRVDILPGGTFRVTNQLTLGSQAELNLAGGTLEIADFESVATVSNDVVDWVGGTLHVGGDASLSPVAVQRFFPAGELNFTKTLRVDGQLQLQTPLVVDGGSLVTFGITNPEFLAFESGRLEWIDSDLVIGPGGPIGADVQLGPQSTIASSEDVIVTGILGGDGTVDSTLVVSTSGELRLAGGERLAVGSTVNEGQIQILGGRLDIDGTLINQAGGNLVGRGTLAATSSTINHGDIAISGGQTDVFGPVANQSTGRVIISGGAAVTFWEPVTHNGAEFHVSENSSVTFFGTAGFGITGGGDVYFEADILPGNSPGLEQFGGDVHFGIDSNLIVEIAGTTLGTEYDSIEIAQSTTIGGTLTVELLGGFDPELGDMFQIVAAESLTGQFAAHDFPTLDGGLAFQTIYQSDAVWLSIVAALAGDFNADGSVDAADYVVWRNTLGSTTALAADADGSGTVDIGDYTIWKSNFGATANSGSLVAASVPEPTSLALLLAIGVTMFTRHVPASFACKPRE